MKKFEFMTQRLLVSLAGVVVLAGCASQGVLIGDVPRDPVPQIVFLGARDAQGADYLTWENVSSFGKVPRGLQAVGDVSCMRVAFNLRATGYHPRALDRSGKAIPGGGYFCQLNLVTGFDQTPPRIVIKDGQSGWDRPGAFGAVPEALWDRARQECARQGKGMKPLGFHSGALDVQGKAVPSGGFLCAE
jgi:hypothetical protein